MVSCVGGRKPKLGAAKTKLNGFVGIGHTGCGPMLPKHGALWGVCCDWFRSGIEIDFDKIQRLLQKCPLRAKAC